MFWTAGFDIIYSCQDREFDAGAGLHSIPRALGVKNALRLSRLLHVVMVLLLVWLSQSFGLGCCWIAVVAALLTSTAWSRPMTSPASTPLSLRSTASSVCCFSSSGRRMFCGWPRRRSIFQSKNVLKWVWTGEGTGWVVISFLAGSRGGGGSSARAQFRDGVSFPLPLPSLQKSTVRSRWPQLHSGSGTAPAAFDGRRRAHSVSLFRACCSSRAELFL